MTAVGPAAALGRAWCVACAVVLAAGRAPAQGFSLGAHIGYNAGFDLNVVGAQLHIPVWRRFGFSASLDRYYDVDGSQSALNADVTFRTFNQSNTRVTFGTGLNLLRITDMDGAHHTTAGLNLLADIEPAWRGPILPFGEMRVTLTNTKDYQLVGGINIVLGRR